jgi:hypothetical protein
MLSQCSRPPVEVSPAPTSRVPMPLMTSGRLTPARAARFSQVKSRGCDSANLSYRMSATTQKGFAIAVEQVMPEYFVVSPRVNQWDA